METTPLKQNNTSILTAGVLIALLICLIYIPNVYDEYNNTHELERSKQIEASEKALALETLTKEKKDFDSLKTEEQQGIIKSIPPVFRQTALMDYLEQLRKGTNITIGQARFDLPKTAGSMKSRDIMLTLQASDKKQVQNVLEYIEKAPLFLSVKNISLQTTTSFVQADLTLTTYFEK